MLVFADRTMTLLDTVFPVQTNSNLIVVFCPGDVVDTVGGATAKWCVPWSKHGIRYNKLQYCCYSMYTFCPLVHFLSPWHKPTCLFCLPVDHSYSFQRNPSSSLQLFTRKVCVAFPSFIFLSGSSDILICGSRWSPACPWVVSADKRWNIWSRITWSNDLRCFNIKQRKCLCQSWSGVWCWEVIVWNDDELKSKPNSFWWYQCAWKLLHVACSSCP